MTTYTLIFIIFFKDSLSDEVFPDSGSLSDILGAGYSQIMGHDFQLGHTSDLTFFSIN